MLLYLKTKFIKYKDLYKKKENICGGRLRFVFYGGRSYFTPDVSLAVHNVETQRLYLRGIEWQAMGDGKKAV